MLRNLVTARWGLIKAQAHLPESMVGCGLDGHLGSAAPAVGLPGKHIVFFGPAIHRRFPERGFALPMIGERSGLLSHELDRGKRSQKSATTGTGFGACKIKFLDCSFQPAG